MAGYTLHPSVCFLPVTMLYDLLYSGVFLQNQNRSQKQKTLTVALLGVLELGVLRPGLSGLDGPLVQVLLQPHQATVCQYGVAAVRVRALGVGRTGVGVVVRQQVVLGGGVDGAVDGAVVGRRAALLRLARVVHDANCWTETLSTQYSQDESFHQTVKVGAHLQL